MNDALQKFTLDVFDAWGAVRTEMNPGVWKVDLPGGEEGQAAWFLGRPTGSLMITFDLHRWEEGTRLECLNLASPLVRRLQQYAEARGCLASVTVEPTSAGSHRYEPYLMARFSSRLASDRVVEEHSWIGYNLTSGKLLRVTGNPFLAPGLREGEPMAEQKSEAKVEERDALEALVASWEEIMATRKAEFERESRMRYEEEASEAQRVLTGADLQDRFKVLADRFALTAETHIEAVLRLWRPVILAGA